ncbi:hypothetical protein SsS58_06394 [Streptomyces scabiei]|uniref:Uncharacterized protein n=2 Tax=Streptomyces scabiei TaxID=1930 RepID=A0A100JUK6_STRSC|nr:hypothetical protein SsS58_06394 [Streptomyces scabiei]
MPDPVQAFLESRRLPARVHRGALLRLLGMVMTVPGFARDSASTGPGDLLHPQEITCERVEGPDCRSRCEGYDDTDACYAACLADRCRDPAWWGGTP